jgi:hypothetical protein
MVLVQASNYSKPGLKLRDPSPRVATTIFLHRLNRTPRRIGMTSRQQIDDCIPGRNGRVLT